MNDGPPDPAEPGRTVPLDEFDPLAELARRRAAEREEDGIVEVLEPDTPMWLSHHWPDAYDRCAVVGGLHICRRCLVLYPLAAVAGVAISLGSWWPTVIDPWVLWLGPLPGVVEFVLDNLGRIRYSPVRQMALSAGGAVAAGVGYTRYLHDMTDPLVWSVVAVYTTICVAAVVAGTLTRRRAA